MPAYKKKHTTLKECKPASSQASVPDPLTPEAFHQYLRTQIRQATRLVMEEIMREELELFVGAAPGSQSQE